MPLRISYSTSPTGRRLGLCKDTAYAAVFLPCRNIVKTSERLRPKFWSHVSEKMEAIHFLRRLYSLDTLDTRLTTSSHIPLRRVSDESSEKSASERGVETDAASLPQGASPSKWRTLEFYFYYAVFVLVVPQMFISVMEVSSRSIPLSHMYSISLIFRSLTPQPRKIRTSALARMDTGP